MQTKSPEYITQQKKQQLKLNKSKIFTQKKNQQRKTVIQLQPFPLLKKTQ